MEGISGLGSTLSKGEKQQYAFEDLQAGEYNTRNDKREDQVRGSFQVLLGKDGGEPVKSFK